MGRYYSGDIEGKFMFAVQSSDAADRFGSVGTSSYINYYFDEEQLEEIETELKTLETSFNKVKEFLSNKNGYNDDMIEQAGITSSEMSDYADYVLGAKIRDCIIEQGSCSFDAEL